MSDNKARTLSQNSLMWSYLTDSSNLAEFAEWYLQEVGAFIESPKLTPRELALLAWQASRAQALDEAIVAADKYVRVGNIIDDLRALKESYNA